MTSHHTFFATTAKGMEAVLREELLQLGAAQIEERLAGAAFSGDLETAYRACLWSRVASRVLLPIATFSAPEPAALYEGVRAIHWRDHLHRGATLAVDCSTSRSGITHSHYGALKTKDAIVDQLRDLTGSRPSVDIARPSVRVNVRLHDDQATISIDLSGESLHRRAYRQTGTRAPLKENLAAAVLLLANWPALARDGAPLLDPMCGSGTLPIEAAMIAADIAPGSAREYFGFLGWSGHDSRLWKRLRGEADERQERDPKKLPRIHGYDVARDTVRAALANVERAGLAGRVHIERRPLAEAEPVAARGALQVPGLLVTNPPYGERLGHQKTLEPLYGTLGDVMRRRFLGWTGCVLTGNLDLGRRIGLKPSRRHVLYNGPIECRLLVFPISSAPVHESRVPRWRQEATDASSAEASNTEALPASAQTPARNTDGRRAANQTGRVRDRLKGKQD